MKHQEEASEQSCEDLLKYLTNSPSTIMTSIAPEGWKNSPYRFIFHPTAQQVYEKRMIWHKNMKSWKKEVDNDDLDMPILEDIEKELAENPKPIEPYEEFLDTLGGCLWCIFSNNHDVVDAEGIIYSLGSFRGSGGFIGDFLNKYFPCKISFDYMDFYCADMNLLDDDDTVYSLLVLLFERLRNRQFDWRYSFPQLNIISFDQPKPIIKPEDYNPQKAMLAELERNQKQAEIQELRDKLDAIYEQEKEDALYKPPPPIIRAYQAVYGCFPIGWVN